MSGSDDKYSELEAVRERLRELEAENARLNASHRATDAARARRVSWRPFASAMLIIVATLLVPFATIAGWAKTELLNEEVFVQTLAPLAKDPAVQAEVSKHASEAIKRELQIESYVNSAFDGLQALDMPEKAGVALDLLRGPAADGIHNLISTAVAERVRSDAFNDTWEVILMNSHRAIVATASGSSGDGSLSISTSGEVVLNLGPVIASAKESLVGQGIDLANSIPEVNATITLAQHDALAAVGPIYHSVVTLGWVLPFVSLGLFLIGIAVARKRRAGLSGTGVGLMLGAGVTLALISSTAVYLSSQSGRFGVSAAAIDAVFGYVAARMIGTSTTIILLGALLLLVVWLTGASSLARALRDTVQSGNVVIGAALHERGFDGGPVGRWVLTQRVLVRALLIVAVVLALVLLPLTGATVVWTAILALVAWWLVALLETVAARPAAEGNLKVEAEGVRDIPDTPLADDASALFPEEGAPSDR